jgi:hypothetical protein
MNLFPDDVAELVCSDDDAQASSLKGVKGSKLVKAVQIEFICKLKRSSVKFGIFAAR